MKDLSKINPEQLSMLDLSVINALGYKGETILQNDKITNGNEGFDAYNYYFNSSYHPSIYAMNELFINTLMFKQAYTNNLSLNNDIAQLLTPTCLFWGRHDLIVASSTLEILFDTLPNVVFSSYFEYSGHSAMITEPIEFIANISTCMRVFTEQAI